MNRKSRQGGAAVELAVCLPLLISVTVFTVDAANVHYAKATLDSAARIGAQRGATQQFTSFTYAAWKDDAETAIREEMAMMPGYEADRLQAAVEASESNERVTVTATAQYRVPTMFNWSGQGTELQLNRRFEIRQVR
ncbi:TadE family protein [Blastopirellula marina]|uniref:TadE-like domain-containing protein n=1 Tax=Blastopirellula marina TaxID=124 RepID=A0A2S8F2T3_9BACT|nr:TadE/TadG family type IV pilus assembly protein [Blastopirellula marina]PQO26460.1 hypothetical protein C5Y98_30445 [Blastopirellula marina]PTL40773.1 pilus assembly protein [Blastopirellula marina]